MNSKIKSLLPAALAAMALTACTDDYGSYGLSTGYGVADPYYDGGFGYGGAPGYAYGGYGYGGLGGWYNDFYYPGTGVYVIDRGGRRHRWSDDQRRYWEGRRERAVPAVSAPATDAPVAPTGRASASPEPSVPIAVRVVPVAGEVPAADATTRPIRGAAATASRASVHRVVPA